MLCAKKLQHTCALLHIRTDYYQTELNYRQTSAACKDLQHTRAYRERGRGRERERERERQREREYNVFFFANGFFCLLINRKTTV